MMKQYFYIAQGSLEPSKCKIGITNDLNRRLKEYNSTTGISAENSYSYLFAAEVSDMRALEIWFMVNSLVVSGKYLCGFK